MAATVAISVRELLLDSSSFGQDEIQQLAEAIAGNQCSAVRQSALELQQRIGEGDTSRRSLLALGMSQYLLARHAEADTTFSQLPDDGIAEFYHARVLVALERYAEAAAKFHSAGEHGYDPVGCKLESAGAIRLSGNADEAEQLLRSTASAGATRAEYSYQMGCILADRGDAYGAIEYFERAVDMDPHHSGALFRLAGQNNTAGNDDEAVRLYERALSKPPLHVGALVNLGLLYEDCEQYSAAAFCFQQVLSSNPNHERARLYLRDIEASTNMFYDEEAIRRARETNLLLEVPIGDFELTARSRNCLERAGITNLGDLTRITEDELLAGKNFGETSLQEIRELLDSRGLRIGQAAIRETQPMPAVERERLSPQERAQIEKPVTDLNLSVRARKCLTRLGITTIGELISKSADDLLGVRNFGVTSLNEIRSRLNDAGMSLRND